MESNIISLLTKYSIQCPDKTAFVILENEDAMENKISYRELESKMILLAALLASQGLAGKRVLLIYQDVLEFMVAFLACQYTGIIPVPVPYSKGNRQFIRLVNIMEDARADSIFCSAHSIPSLQQGLSAFPGAAGIQLIATDTDPAAGTPSFPQEPAYNKIAFIQYTSGATGKPKGVVISNSNLLHNQALIKNAFRCDETAVIFSWLPFHHDMGLIGNILHTIYVGATCILMSPLNFMQTPKRWLKGISDYKATHSGGPNFAYDLCVDRITPEELPGLDLSGWRVAYNGSEPIRSSTMQRFGNYFKTAGFRQSSFYPCYGLAEATLLVSAHTSGLPPVTARLNAAAKPVPGCGTITPGITVKIMEQAGEKECADDQEGEICICGQSVTEGYWNKDNKAFFIDIGGVSFLKTGDLGFFHNKELFVNGRLKEMFIIRGRNFYPQDIEEYIASSHSAIESNGVAIFSISGQNDAEEGSSSVVIIAEIKRTWLRDLEAEKLIASIDHGVNGFFGINSYDILLIRPLGIPRTTSGKLQRTQCKEHYRRLAFNTVASKRAIGSEQQREDRSNGQKSEGRRLLIAEVIRSGDYTAIRTYLVALLSAGVGPVPNLQDQADLTETGVDSLRSMEMLNTINQDLHINLDIRTAFRDNTLSGLIHLLENILWLKNGQTSGQEITI